MIESPTLAAHNVAHSLVTLATIGGPEAMQVLVDAHNGLLTDPAPEANRIAAILELVMELIP